MICQLELKQMIEFLKKEGYTVRRQNWMIEKEKLWFEELEVLYEKLYKEDFEKLLGEIDYNKQTIKTIKEELKISYRNQMKMLVLFNNKVKEFNSNLRHYNVPISCELIENKFDTIIEEVREEMNMNIPKEFISSPQLKKA